MSVKRACNEALETLSGEEPWIGVYAEFPGYRESLLEFAPPSLGGQGITYRIGRGTDLQSVRVVADGLQIRPTMIRQLISCHALTARGDLNHHDSP